MTFNNAPHTWVVNPGDTQGRWGQCSECGVLKNDNAVHCPVRAERIISELRAELAALETP